MNSTIAALKARPSSIRIFLADGSPVGLRLVEKSNWIGQGMVFPRSSYNDIRKRDEFDRIGIYVISGQSSDSGREVLYIGEGDPIGPRLDSHNREKDFWTQGFVFRSKDANLNKAHVQYLESRLCELAVAAKRVQLDNGNVPTKPSLSEADQAEMEAFLAEMLICFPVLGLTAFEKPPEQPIESIVYHVRGRGADARGYETNEGFVVKSASTLSNSEAESAANYVSALRSQLVEAGVIDTTGGRWTLTQDYIFSSPSTAASVVLGRNANGRTEWKDGHSRTLKEIQES